MIKPEKLKFTGYRRPDGRFGVRNHVVILPVDDISNAAAEGVAGDAAVEDIHATAAPPNESLEREELAKELRAALVRLPADQAEAFCLRHVEGMSYEEIGAQTGMTPNAAGVLIHRAKERLRELLNVCEIRRGDI